MKKNIPCLLALSALLFAGQVNLSAEGNPYSGRIQYSGLPGSSDTALAHVGPRVPQSEVRVGPSSNPGVGLAFLIGIEVPSDNARNALMMAEKIEFVVNVQKVDHYNGGPPSALQVAFLASSVSADQWANYGAWNNANNFEVIGMIEADPEAGEYRFDITNALQNAPATTANKPLIYFGIYSPEKDLVEANAGQHVLLEASGGLEPRIEIGE